MADAPAFVHLHTHSDYSLLDGSMKVQELARKSAGLGMSSVALTDHGNLFGAVDFYLACQREGVKPILGMEAYVVKDRTATTSEGAGRTHHLILLAENEVGWKNLVKLASRSYLEGLHDKPRVDKELLSRHREGLIAMGSCLEGEVNAALMAEDMVWARKALGEHQDIFGVDGFYVEIQNHGWERQARHRALAAQLAAETGAKLVATNNTHYLTRQHASAHDVLMAIQTGRTVDDPSRWRYEGDQHYLKSPAEMAEAFVDFPDALANSVAIADRCNVELVMGQHLLPIFPLPDRFESLDEYLRELAYQGAMERYGGVSDAVRERLNFELDVIKTTGFAGYFLITSDFVMDAKNKGIPVGPGRGSAAGSLVCYCIRITDIDPLAHGLLFERFLNPERISMPDIDIDFCFERRGEVIDYVNEKYGAGSVCQIITYGAMLARGVIRDVGRALGLNYGEVDRIAKLVPEQLGITLEKALEKEAELRDVRAEDPRYDSLIDNALALEGLYRHSSIHAAGVLIAPGDLTDHVPLYKSGKEEITTQWDMKMVEVMGLLKMDFLGLRTLTVIDHALEFIRAEHPQLGELKAEEIDLNDPAIYELLAEGETVGVFQLESSGMQEVLRKLKPSSFEDITAVNALYRPGPLGSGMVDDFIERKHGRKSIEYLHPLLEPILEGTYGVILYQEQVMRIASDMAGFTMGQADTLRKAMGKKKIDVMEQMKELFVDGSIERGVDKRIAVEIFELMAYFAGYGFNKSHSASYAVLSAQTAWLKAHHPAAFFAATLTSEMSNSTRVVTLVDEVRHQGLSILPPDVNSCTADFRVIDGAVRFGLGAVKNVGRGAIEAIVEAREDLGRGFESLYEFCETIDLSRVNRRVIESLILGGALDGLPGRREQMLAGLDLALSRAQRHSRDQARGQASLFGGAEGEERRGEGVLPEVDVWDEGDRLAKEKELIGFYLTGHPLDAVKELLEWLPFESTKTLTGRGDDEPLALCGVIQAVKTVTTRSSGRVMAFVGVEDFAGSCEAICFPEAYEANRAVLTGGEVIQVLAGRSSVREGEEPKLVVEKVFSLDDACALLVAEIHIDVGVDLSSGEVASLLELVAGHPGSTPLFLHLRDGEFETEMKATRAAVRPTADLLLGLTRILGRGAVRPTVRSGTVLAGNGERRGRRRWASAREESSA